MPHNVAKAAAQLFNYLTTQFPFLITIMYVLVILSTNDDEVTMYFEILGQLTYHRQSGSQKSIIFPNSN